MHRAEKPRQPQARRPGPDRTAFHAEVPGAHDRVHASDQVGDRQQADAAGAHGHAMGFQYNGKLRSAELLLREDRSVMPIRRAETLDDYFATLDFSKL